MSKQTAELVSIADKKGSLEVGKHADFVVWDPEAKFKVGQELVSIEWLEQVEPDNLHMKNRITSPYNGQELYGKVQATFLRGTLVYEQGTGFTTEQPQGVWVKPSTC